jgi:hypothetical protein
MRTTKLAFGYVDKFISYILKHIVKGRFRHHAEYIGTFALIYLGLAGGFIAFTMFMGINPTLIVSVVAAPIWIGIVFLSNRITKIAIALKDVDIDQNIKEEEDVIIKEDSKF